MSAWKPEGCSFQNRKRVNDKGLREVIGGHYHQISQRSFFHVVSFPRSHLEIRTSRDPYVYLDELVLRKVCIRVVLDQILRPQLIRKLIEDPFQHLSISLHVYLILVNIL